MGLNKELLDLLVCPRCKGELETTEAEDGLICRKCELVYPVEDGIPIMLIDEAISLADWESAGNRQTQDQS